MKKKIDPFSKKNFSRSYHPFEVVALSEGTSDLGSRYVDIGINRGVVYDMYNNIISIPVVEHPFGTFKNLQTLANSNFIDYQMRIYSSSTTKVNNYLYIRNVFSGHFANNIGGVLRGSRIERTTNPALNVSNIIALVTYYVPGGSSDPVLEITQYLKSDLFVCSNNSSHPLLTYNEAFDSSTHPSKSSKKSHPNQNNQSPRVATSYRGVEGEEDKLDIIQVVVDNEITSVPLIYSADGSEIPLISFVNTEGGGEEEEVRRLYISISDDLII